MTTLVIDHARPDTGSAFAMLWSALSNAGTRASKLRTCSVELEWARAEIAYLHSQLAERESALAFRSLITALSVGLGVCLLAFACAFYVRPSTAVLDSLTTRAGRGLLSSQLSFRDKKVEVAYRVACFQKSGWLLYASVGASSLGLVGLLVSGVQTSMCCMLLLSMLVFLVGRLRIPNAANGDGPSPTLDPSIGFGRLLVGVALVNCVTFMVVQTYYSNPEGVFFFGERLLQERLHIYGHVTCAWVVLLRVMHLHPAHRIAFESIQALGHLLSPRFSVLTKSEEASIL